MQQFMVSWGFFIAAAFFLIAAAIPLVRGEGLDLTRFILGVVFLVLGAVRSGRDRDSGSG